MNKDDAGQVFDVSKPNRVPPSPTSRPIIVGHQPMMSDPMVTAEEHAPETALPSAPMEHKMIPISTPDEKPQETPHEMPQPQTLTPAPPPAAMPPAVAAEAPPAEVPAVAPEHPESVKASGLTDQAAQPAPPPGDLNLESLDDVIGHEHRPEGSSPHHHEHPPAQPHPHPEPPPQKHGKKKKHTALWVLLGIIVIFVGAYLLIDSRTIKTSVNLPFHIFKQPAAQPVAVPTTAAVVKTVTTTAKDPYAGWKTFTLSNEKLAFQYPTAWTIKDNTATVNDKGDSITISGPNNFEMTVNTGLEDYSLPVAGVTVDYADPIAFLAQQAYMDFTEVGKQNTSTISFVNLSLSNTDPAQFVPTKNVAGSNIKVSWHYLGSDGKTIVTKSETFIKSDPNYIDAKLMLQSMHY